MLGPHEIWKGKVGWFGFFFIYVSHFLIKPSPNHSSSHNPLQSTPRRGARNITFKTHLEARPLRRSEPQIAALQACRHAKRVLRRPRWGCGMYLASASRAVSASLRCGLAQTIANSLFLARQCAMSAPVEQPQGVSLQTTDGAAPLRPRVQGAQHRGEMLMRSGNVSRGRNMQGSSPGTIFFTADRRTSCAVIAVASRPMPLRNSNHIRTRCYRTRNLKAGWHSC